MNLEKFTQKSREAIYQAQQAARDHHHQTIEPIHLLLALLQQNDGVVPAIVTKITGSVLAIRDEINQELGNRPQVHGSNVETGLSNAFVQAVEAAEKYAKGMQDEFVSTEHLLLGLSDSIE
ncbi:MAG TPA: Clp protease N-terminal domain-containing protein, partial [Anaerolineaceae bacterium]|nr:Clp protease N-terminal domain-containing protein [Anaerolineaceae bacterium]